MYNVRTFCVTGECQVVMKGTYIATYVILLRFCSAGHYAGLQRQNTNSEVALLLEHRGTKYKQS